MVVSFLDMYILKKNRDSLRKETFDSENENSIMNMVKAEFHILTSLPMKPRDRCQYRHYLSYHLEHRKHSLLKHSNLEGFLLKEIPPTL